MNDALKLKIFTMMEQRRKEMAQLADMLPDDTFAKEYLVKDIHLLAGRFSQTAGHECYQWQHAQPSKMFCLPR